MENTTSPDALLNADNASWLEEHYRTWLRSPEMVPEDWRRFFLTEEFLSDDSAATSNVTGTTIKKQAAVTQLIQAWRNLGHLRAKLDPLDMMQPPDVPQLTPAFWGLSSPRCSSGFFSAINPLVVFALVPALLPVIVMGTSSDANGFLNLAKWQMKH